MGKKFIDENGVARKGILYATAIDSANEDIYLVKVPKAKPFPSLLTGMTIRSKNEDGFLLKYQSADMWIVLTRDFSEERYLTRQQWQLSRDCISKVWDIDGNLIWEKNK